MLGAVREVNNQGWSGKGVSEKLNRITSGLRIPLYGELGMFAELKEVALDL